MSASTTKPNWFAILNEANRAEVLLYGEIGTGWDGSGSDANGFTTALDAIPEDQDILLRIHSPGGSVFDGLAIYNTLLRRRDHVTARIDGVALSAASFVAMAAKRIEMPKTARMMIHDAQGLAIGDSRKMREMAELLEKESANIAAIYAERTGLSQKKCRDLMAATTWMNGAEAKELGFCDQVLEAPAVENKFDLSRFRVVPGRETSTQPTGHTPVTPPPNNTATDMEPTTAPQNTAQTTPPAAPPPPVDMSRQFADLQNRLTQAEQAAARERETRIRNEVARLAATRPSIDVERDAPLAIANENLITVFARFPESGGEPIRPSGIANGGNPLITEYERLSDGDGHVSLENSRRRIELRRTRMDQLVSNYHRFNPQNVNTIDSALVTQALIDGVQVVVADRLAMLSAFTTDFSTRPMAPMTTYQCRINSAGPTVQTDATNFESGDSTLDNRPVTVHQYTAPYHITNAQLQAGHRLEMLSGMAAVNLANAISDVVTACMVAGDGSTTGFGAAVNIGAAASFTGSDLAAVLAAAKNYDQKVLLLDGGHLAYLLPTDKVSFRFGESGAYGFDTIYQQNRWTSATANACGFVCQKNALLCLAGTPEQAPTSSGLLSSSTFTLQQGLTVTAYQWFNPAGRVWWGSLDVIFGAGCGDGTGGEVLVTA